MAIEDNPAAAERAAKRALRLLVAEHDFNVVEHAFADTQRQVYRRRWEAEHEFAGRGSAVVVALGIAGERTAPFSIPRWLDHAGLWRRKKDGADLIRFEPYQIDDVAVEELLEAALRADWRIEISGRSGHFPRRTFSVILTRRSDGIHAPHCGM